jgi:hypothetical protein
MLTNSAEFIGQSINVITEMGMTTNAGEIKSILQKIQNFNGLTGCPANV